jgi:hypothetical protein
MARFRRRKCDKYVARAASLLQERGLSGTRMSFDLVKQDYEAVLLSKLKDQEIDVVGLVRIREKLGNRDSGVSILPHLQATSCDILATSWRP